MGRSTTPSFVLETPIPPGSMAKYPSKKGKDSHDSFTSAYALFEREENCSRQIYNHTIDYLLGRLNQLKQDKHYRALLQEKCETRDIKRLSVIIKELHELEKKYGLTQYSAQDAAREFAKIYPFFGAKIAEKLGARAFLTVQKYRFGNAKKVRFKSRRDDMSFAGKSNQDTLRFVPESNTLIFCKAHIHIPIDPADYLLQYCLQHNRIKYVAITARTIRGCKRRYLQITFEGPKPLTRGQNKILAAILAAVQQSGIPYCKRTVGVDAGVSTMAAVSAELVKFFELCPEVREEKRHIVALQRALDRLRRASNPDNYNPDGTCKKRKEQKPWVYSRNYRKLQQQLRDKQRKLAARRREIHRRNAMALAAIGGDVRVEHMIYAGLAKRSSEPAEINEKTGKYKRKKRFGSSILQNAPSLFLSQLEYYVTLFGGTFRKVNNWTVRASQYNPFTGEYVKHELKDRWIEVGRGIWLQRDLLAAFLLFCTYEELKYINARLVQDRLAAFINMHDELIPKLLATKSTTFRWYFRHRPPISALTKHLRDDFPKSITGKSSKELSGCCANSQSSQSHPSSEPSEEKSRPDRTLSEPV